MLNRHDTKKLLRNYNDLKVQAMLFDMDIDLETASLVEKRTMKEPTWLTRWKEKRHAADLNEYSDYDR